MNLIVTIVLKKDIGVRGFEPPTSASQTLRASQLRYTQAGKV